MRGVYLAILALGFTTGTAEAQCCRTEAIETLLSDDPQTNAMMGAGQHSVAVSGGTAVVGVAAYNVGTDVDAGAFLVFDFDGTDWDQTSEIVAGNGEQDDYFGTAVAIDGAWLVVGAPGQDGSGGKTDAGSAYVFERVSGSWVERTELTAADADTGDAFGSDVTIWGQWIAVGAPHEAGAGSDAGAVYVFERSGTTWTQKGKLVADATDGDDLFGTAVDMRDSLLVVGAPGAGPVEVFGPEGDAYVFRNSGSNWLEEDHLNDTGIANDFGDYQFGWDVAVSGDRIVVGAPGFQRYLIRPDAGLAVVYRRTEVEPVPGSLQAPDAPVFVQWDQEQLISSCLGLDRKGDQFGYSVDLDGTVMIVGSPALVTDDPERGYAQVFQFLEATWENVEQPVAEGQSTPGDGFGRAVALRADVALATEPLKDDGSTSQAGALYPFVEDFATALPCPCLGDLDGYPTRRVQCSAVRSGDRSDHGRGRRRPVCSGLGLNAVSHGQRLRQRLGLLRMFSEPCNRADTIREAAVVLCSRRINAVSS